MPQTDVYFFSERLDSGQVRIPVLEWIQEQGNRLVEIKARARIQRLQDLGYELGPPEAKRLSNSDGIYELRFDVGDVPHRILYCLCTVSKTRTAVLLVGLTKESEVPRGQIVRAETRAEEFKADPARFSTPFSEWD